ncbi:MAG: MFS transporter, partial [Candidatus Heimdallarchaeaceae archaeon]
EEILLDSTKVETNWSLRSIFRTPTLILSYLGGHFSRVMDSIIVLLLPILASTIYHYPPFQVGLITAGFTLAWAVSMPFTGKFSDRFGRKETIIVGLFVEGISIITLTFLSIFPAVLILSIVAGFGTALYYPSLPSITRDIVPIVKREQSIGLYRSTLDSGYFSGPLIAIGLVYAAQNLLLWNFNESTSQVLKLENMIKFPFLIIGSALCLISVLFIIFSKETRPGWVQSSQSIRHGYKVIEVFKTISKAFNEYLDNPDEQSCIDYLAEAKELEREADKLVFKVTQALYSSIRPAPDDYHFYKITDILDTAIGFSLRSLRKMILIPRKKLPESFATYLKKECDLLIQLITKTVDALEVVCIQPRSSHPIFTEVHSLENALDINSQEGLKNFIEEQGTLNSVEKLFVIQIIESLETSANTIEDAADVMKILGLKHQASHYSK